MNDHDKKLWELTKKYMGKKHGYDYMRELRDIFLDDELERWNKIAESMDKSLRQLKEPPPIKSKNPPKWTD